MPGKVRFILVRHTTTKKSLRMTFPFFTFCTLRRKDY